MKTYKTKYKNRIKDLETIKNVFDKYGVKFFIGYGSVLGFYRDGDFIEHDDDIDLCVVDEVSLKTRKQIGWALYDLGFQPQQIVFNVFGRMEPSEIGYNGDEKTGIIVCERNFKFTIFFFQNYPCEQHKILEYICVPKLGALNLISTPASFFIKGEEVKINGRKYLFPSPIERYLEVCYRNWRDKHGRDHSPTFFENHPMSEEEKVMLNLEDKNQLAKYD